MAKLVFEPTQCDPRIHAFNPYLLLPLRFQHKETMFSIPQLLKPFREQDEGALNNPKGCVWNNETFLE